MRDEYECSPAFLAVKYIIFFFFFPVIVPHRIPVAYTYSHINTGASVFPVCLLHPKARRGHHNPFYGALLNNYLMTSLPSAWQARRPRLADQLNISK
jgi:hypothetical protein